MTQLPRLKCHERWLFVILLAHREEFWHCTCTYLYICKTYFKKIEGVDVDISSTVDDDRVDSQVSL